MSQRLIVEGKDAISLSEILKRRGLKPPLGYANPKKFEKEFVIEAGGKSEILSALQEALETPSISNIGIIIDADDDEPKSKLQSIVNFLEEVLEEKIGQISLSEKGAFLQFFDSLKIGIWVMPNNLDNGYLEHFLADLIPKNNQTWQFAQEKVQELVGTEFCEFSKVATQKALLYTYLAWKETPGLPFGTAVKSKYLNANSKNADQFANWFQNTFELTP